MFSTRIITSASRSLLSKPSTLRTAASPLITSRYSSTLDSQTISTINQKEQQLTGQSEPVPGGPTARAQQHANEPITSQVLHDITEGEKLVTGGERMKGGPTAATQSTLSQAINNGEITPPSQQGLGGSGNNVNQVGLGGANQGQNQGGLGASQGLGGIQNQNRNQGLGGTQNQGGTGGLGGLGGNSSQGGIGGNQSHLATNQPPRMPAQGNNNNNSNNLSARGGNLNQQGGLGGGQGGLGGNQGGLGGNQGGLGGNQGGLGGNQGGLQGNNQQGSFQGNLQSGQPGGQPGGSSGTSQAGLGGTRPTVNNPRSLPGDPVLNQQTITQIHAAEQRLGGNTGGGPGPATQAALQHEGETINSRTLHDITEGEKMVTGRNESIRGGPTSTAQSILGRSRADKGQR